MLPTHLSLSIRRSLMEIRESRKNGVLVFSPAEDSTAISDSDWEALYDHVVEAVIQGGSQDMILNLVEVFCIASLVVKTIEQCRTFLLRRSSDLKILCPNKGAREFLKRSCSAGLKVFASEDEALKSCVFIIPSVTQAPQTRGGTYGRGRKFSISR